MKDVDIKLGLTNILKRLAYSCLTKGLGRHPIEHAVYDAVDVAEMYPWIPNPTQKDEHGAGIRVTFFRKDKKVRWVEFSVRDVGGGGDLSIFSIK